jgi:hypothetical protein
MLSHASQLATTQSAPPGVQPAVRLNEKKNATALFRAPVSAASQPANRYAERTARHPAGAPGSEQFSPACHDILCGCRGEYRHPTTEITENINLITGYMY